MNQSLIDPILMLVLLINFLLIGAGRLRSIIQAVALQGVIPGVVYAVAHLGSDDSGDVMIHVRTLALAAAIIALKGYVVPHIMFYAMRAAHLQRYSEPYLGATGSMLLGAVGIGLVMAVTRSLPMRGEDASHLVVAASFTTVLTGFLMMIMRREALAQVAGYLVLENGIFIFGLLLLEAMPMLVEIGIILDLFVGVLVMGIVIHHINVQFSASSLEHLSSLKD
jgi:hydrogenase-4 component E